VNEKLIKERIVGVKKIPRRKVSRNSLYPPKTRKKVEEWNTNFAFIQILGDRNWTKK